MPQFKVEMTVVRTICQSKSVEIIVEADDETEAEDKAMVEAEKSIYHNTEEQNWDLDQIESEGQDLEITPLDSEDDADASD